MTHDMLSIHVYPTLSFKQIHDIWQIFPSPSFEFVHTPYMDCETTKATLHETKSLPLRRIRPTPKWKQKDHLPTIESQGAKCEFQGG